MANTKKYISLDKLEKYDDLIKGVISAGDDASLASAKTYADGLAVNYDAAGTAATEAGKVQANLDAEVLRAKAAEEANAKAAKQAQDEVDALELVVDTKAAQADLTALSNKVGEVPSDKTVMGIIGEIQSGNATDNEAIQAQISALSENKADKAQVALDIAAAVKVETDARVEAIEAVQGEVDALEKVHADDKAVLEGAIELKADQTALDEVSAVANAAVAKSVYDAKVEELVAEDARIAGLVSDEAAKAREEEGKLDARLDKVEAFFEGAAEDGEGLQNALDTLVEIQTYVDTNGEAAAKMVEDIAANKKAIEDHEKIDHDFAGADAALKEELNAEIAKKATIETVNGIDGRLTTAEGKITTVEGKVSTLEGEMDAVEAAVATKAEAQALADAVSALEGVDAGQETRIAALEAKFGDGEGNVEDMIATAKQEAIDAAAADAKSKADKALEDAKAYVDGEIDAVEGAISALEGVVNTKAAQADLEALAGRVTTAEGEIDTLQSEMDAVELLAAVNKAAHEANASAIALKASQEDLDKVAGRVTTLETWHSNFVEASEEEINALFTA